MLEWSPRPDWLSRALSPVRVSPHLLLPEGVGRLWWQPPANNNGWFWDLGLGEPARQVPGAPVPEATPLLGFKVLSYKPSLLWFSWVAGWIPGPFLEKQRPCTPPGLLGRRVIPALQVGAGARRAGEGSSVLGGIFSPHGRVSFWPQAAPPSSPPPRGAPVRAGPQKESQEGLWRWDLPVSPARSPVRVH